MISFIIPYASKGDNLYNWGDTDYSFITFTTILAIKNINKIFSSRDIEIILVDNTNTFPKIKIPNLKIVKGLQYKKQFTEKEISEYNITEVTNHTMWASIAYNIGIEHSAGEYVILQHNDIFYHQDLLSELIDILKTNEYVSVDSKKINLTGYLQNKTVFDELGVDPIVGHDSGGYIKTKKFGLSDAYFFMCKKEFFDNYIVDYGYGDTNHGATIKCLLENKKFYHIEPYYENPNFKSPTKTQNDYILNDKLFVTHLKGGFSEKKLSYKENMIGLIPKFSNAHQVTMYLETLNNTLL